MTIEITFITLTAITVGLTEVCKRMLPDSLKSRLAPLLAILFAVALSLGAMGVHYTSVIAGLVIGLSASGLYSGGKSTIKG